MAVGGFAVSSSEGGEYNGRMTIWVILSSMVAATGGLIFGYDLGVSGGVTAMGPFLEKFFPDVFRKMQQEGRSISNYCIFESQLLTLFTSSLYFAGLVASFFASPITRSLGRKASILVGGVAFLTGSALGAAALNVYMLIFGRLLLGVGVGFSNQSVPLYVSEMALPRHRGGLNIGFQCGLCIGVLSANVINFWTQKLRSGYGWRISLALAAAPATILTLTALFLPETPNSLVHTNPGKAKCVLQRIRGTPDVQTELDDLVKASTAVAQSSEESSFKRIIMQRRYRPQLVMAFAIPFFQQVTGINVITFYAPLLFRTIGQGESDSLLSSIVIGVVGTTATFISMSVVDRFGRRKLFMVGGLQMLVSQLVIGGMMAFWLGDHGRMSRSSASMVLGFMCVYIAGFSWSWGPLGWLVPSEIFPLEIRSAGLSVTVAVAFVFTFVIAQTFLSMLCHFQAAIFFFFGAWVAAMNAFVYFFLPETKNVPIEQMEKVWTGHWFWRGFVVDHEHCSDVGNTYR